MRNHFQDFTHLKRLIKAETDPAKRRRYILLQRALYASITFTFCLIITFFAATVRGKSTPQPTQIPATAQP